MVFQEDIVVRVRYVTHEKELAKIDKQLDKLNKMAGKEYITKGATKRYEELLNQISELAEWRQEYEKPTPETTKTVRTVQNLGDKFKIVTKRFRQGNLIFKETAMKMRGFRMELLSVMFFGMQLERIFKGLTATSMEWMGVSETLSTFLGVAFLPIGEIWLNLVLLLWAAWDALGEPMQYVIRALVLAIGVIGPIIALLIGFKLGLIGIAFMFGTTVAAILPIIAVIVLVIAIIGLLWYIWENNLGGIRDITKAVFDFIWEKINWVMNSVKWLVSNALDFLRAIWEGRWGDAREIVKNVLISILAFLGSLGIQFYNIAKDLLQNFINGIWSMLGKVRDAFWNLLPDWMKNIILRVGAFAGTAFDWIRGLWGGQAGGIVTRPTPALLGERGPEAVIPLDRIGNIGGVYVTINTSTIGGNVDILAREIADKFAFELSRVRY